MFERMLIYLREASGKMGKGDFFEKPSFRPNKAQ
jgi:hypothetical protein